MSDAPIIGNKILRYTQVESTNDLARELAERGEPEGLVVTAEEQRAGRGRMGRRWIVPPATSLQLSILLRPNLSAQLAARITQMAALGIAKMLESELRLKPVLKWPNDVLLPVGGQTAFQENSSSGTAAPEPSNLRKVVGILAESSLAGERVQYTILGIGLNVNFSMDAYPELAPTATSLQDIVGHKLDRTVLEQALYAHLDGYYQRVQRGESLLSEFRSHLGMLGVPLRIATADGILDGIARDVAEDGALIVETNRGLTRLYAGDVTILKTPDS